MRELVIVSVLVIVSDGCGGGRAREEPPVRVVPGREVTIYDSRAEAVVVDRRWVEVAQGDSEIALGDLPAAVEPGSMAVRPLGGGVEVRERWLEGRAAPEVVLAEAIGKEVEVGRAGGAVRGRLVGVQGGALVVDGAGGRSAVPLEEVTSVGVAGAAPAARPVLHARVRAEGGGRRLLELVYATGALGFGVSYELEVVDPVAPRVQVRARARIENRSGLELAGARVHLVTGSLEDAEHAPLEVWNGWLRLAGAAGAEDRQVDVVATAAPVAARYEAVYRGAVADQVVAPTEVPHGSASQPTVARHLLVPVARGGPLGAVLPPGPALVVVAAAEPGGVARRLTTRLDARAVAGGEARFPLDLEPALVGSRRQVRADRAPDATRLTETYELAVHNSGSAPARVRIVEPLTRSAHVVIDASEPRAAHDAEARELVWVVDVPPGGDHKVTYTATYRFDR